MPRRSDKGKYRIRKSKEFQEGEEMTSSDMSNGMRKRIQGIISIEKIAFHIGTSRYLHL